MQPGDFVEVVVTGDDLAFQVLGQEDELHIHRLAIHLWQLAIVDFQINVFVVSQAVENVQAPSAAGPPQLVRRIGDALQLGQHEPRHDELIVEYVRLDQIGDPPVDHDARIEDIRLEPFDFLREFDIGNDETKIVLRLDQ